MMLFKKLLLPASVILVLAGCGNTQDTLPADHTGVASSSSTWSIDQAGDNANVETDDYAENDDDIRSTERASNLDNTSNTDNTSNPPAQENGSDAGNVSATVKTTTSVETSVSADSSTSVETSTSVEMNHSSNPSPTTVPTSELPIQQNDDILRYMEECTQTLEYIGQEMKQAGDFSTMQEPTLEKAFAQIKSHRKNIDERIQTLESITIPQINNPSIREKVKSIRDHTLDMGNTASDMMDVMVKYMQTEDESYYSKYQKMSEQVTSSYMELIEQAAQLAIQLD